MSRLIKYLLVIMATLTLLAILWQFRLILLLFGISLFIAAAIRPFAEWLVERGISKATGQVLLYGLGTGIFLLSLLLFGDRLLLEFNTAANQAVTRYEVLQHRWQEGAQWQQIAAESLLPPLPFSSVQDTDLNKMLLAIINMMGGFLKALGSLALLLILSIYWSVDQHRFERLWLSLLPAKRRTQARNSWRNIETVLGTYLRIQILQSVTVALLLGVGARLAGLAYPLLLALLGAFAAFIPLLGDFITAAIAYWLGSLISYEMGIIAFVFTLAIFIGLKLLVEPKLWPQERRSFLLTILVVWPLLDAFGLWGFILARPLALVLEVIIRQMYQVYTSQQDTAVRLDDLEVRYRQLKQKIARAENGDIAPDLRNLVKRLGTLLTDSQYSLPSHRSAK